MEMLQNCYDRYVKRIEKAQANASPLGGIFGFGGGVKNDSCHVQFYEEVSACVEEFRASAPEEAAVYAWVRYLLTSASEHRPTEDVYGMLIAIQGCAKELIPLLSREHKKELLDFYQDAFPRHKRLPIQEQVVKLLKK